MSSQYLFLQTQSFFIALIAHKIYGYSNLNRSLRRKCTQPMYFISAIHFVCIDRLFDLRHTRGLTDTAQKLGESPLLRLVLMSCQWTKSKQMMLVDSLGAWAIYINCAHQGQTHAIQLTAWVSKVCWAHQMMSEIQKYIFAHSIS